MSVVFSCTFPLKCSFKSGESGWPLCLPKRPPSARLPADGAQGGDSPPREACHLSHWLHFHVTLMLALPKVHLEKILGYVL